MPDRPATLRDVAAAARVHPATASRALNPETRILVSEDTARRVSDVAARLGYRPNPVARSLRTRRSHTVGVLIPDLNNPLFPPIVRGLEDKLAAAKSLSTSRLFILNHVSANDTSPFTSRQCMFSCDHELTVARVHAHFSARKLDLFRAGTPWQRNHRTSALPIGGICWRN